MLGHHLSHKCLVLTSIAEIKETIVIVMLSQTFLSMREQKKNVYFFF